MSFWVNNMNEPKRQFRFAVTFGAVGINSKLIAQAADRPTYQIKGDTAVHFLDKQFMFPGKITWNPVKLRFVDGIMDGSNTSRASYDYLAKAGWVSPTENFTNLGSSFATINKQSSVAGSQSGRGDVTVNVLGPEGNAVDVWVLKNAFITTVALNGLDYSQDGILTTEYTLVYDWAELPLSQT